MDIIYLNNLHVDTEIGIFEWERRVRQTVIMDLEMGYETASAAASDSINDTVDYKKVADRITEVAKQSSYGLVESLAEALSRVLLDEFGVPWFRLRINKQGAVQNVRDVGIIIERGSR
ncbi:MAG: dihydroneopterin aldolase [Gammaproteobacteria bacterium]|nr:dihydroneopterin aldolase [Gammaproteobacteria bacterium]